MFNQIIVTKKVQIKLRAIDFNPYNLYTYIKPHNFVKLFHRMIIVYGQFNKPFIILP